MKAKVILCLFLLFFSHLAVALSERHLMILRHGEGDCDLTNIYHSNPQHAKFSPYPLTDRGQLQIKKAAEALLNNSFDNRSIVAVYVSPLPRALQSAHVLAEIGVFTTEKIHIDNRLTEIQAGNREGDPLSGKIKETWLVGAQEAKSYQGESNIEVHDRILSFYDEIEKKHPQGHVLIITHGIPAMELIDSIAKQKVKLSLAQAYVVPLANRKELLQNL